ncbi:hypothetical protein SAMN06298224_1110, partial [Fibrobacter sp. UWB16]
MPSRNKSGMTAHHGIRGSSCAIRGSGGRDKKEKAPPDVLRQAGRESSGDLLSRARGPGTIG